jgi:hypothetical protein
MEPGWRRLETICGGNKGRYIPCYLTMRCLFFDASSAKHRIFEAPVAVAPGEHPRPDPAVACLDSNRFL